MNDEAFACYLVTKTGKDEIRGSVERRPIRELPAGDVLVRVAWSSLNYKDALASQGHPGIVRRFPHVPGIDAAGVVATSSSHDYSVGQPVLVTSYELGAGQWGGWAEYVRVPAAWVIPLPDGMTLRQAMTYGTAGLTAAMSLAALERNQVTPSAGPVVVTGASGGVGSLAVELLSRQGYQVTAITGKAEQHAWLRELGATEVLGRDSLQDDSGKPLLKTRWGGGVDTAGGSTLANILRSAEPRACIAACGMVGGTELPLSIYPFILRGVTLCGIDSAQAPREERIELWKRLAGPWRLPLAERECRETTLQELPRAIEPMRRGLSQGRVVIRVGPDDYSAE
jgi:acrylyl-CoA reductase (NADPH)